MASKTLYLENNITDNWPILNDGTAQTAATTASGWTVSTGSTNHSELESGTERAASTFTGTGPPDGSLDSTLGDAFRAGPFTGNFANANWTFQFAVRAVTNGGAQDGRIRFRLFRSANANGSGATEITGAQQQASLVSNVSTSADFNSTLTFNPGAVSLDNEYLFVQVAWERTGAGGMTNSDILLRTGSSGPAGTHIVTSNFTEIAAGDGSASGVATVDGAGQATAKADGDSDGVGTATADGVIIKPGDGDSDGVATASGDIEDAAEGGPTIVEGDGVASGVGTASGAGVAIKPGDGDSDGVAAATGVGVAFVQGDGDADGIAAAVATGAETAQTSGTSQGTAAAAGSGATILSADGTSQAAATAQGDLIDAGQPILEEGSGVASGTSDVLGALENIATPPPPPVFTGGGGAWTTPTISRPRRRQPIVTAASGTAEGTSRAHAEIVALIPGAGKAWRTSKAQGDFQRDWSPYNKRLLDLVVRIIQSR